VPDTRPESEYVPSAAVVAVWPPPASITTSASGSVPALTVPSTVYVMRVAAKSLPVASGPSVTATLTGSKVYSALSGVSV